MNKNNTNIKIQSLLVNNLLEMEKLLISGDVSVIPHAGVIRFYMARFPFFKNAIAKTQFGFLFNPKKIPIHHSKEIIDFINNDIKVYCKKLIKSMGND